MPTLSQRLYCRVTDAELADLEDAQDDPVAREAPANFFRLLFARTGSKIADRLSNPKTTLAWILQALGAPAIFTGLIVPLRESGSLLPQVFLSNYLKRYPLRKWAWTLGAIIQGLAIAGCALVTLTQTGTMAGAAITALVAVFALARGISSVSAKDVLGKTLPKSKRGQLTGWAGSASGLIAVVAAGFLFLPREDPGSLTTYALYLGGAAFLWWLAAAANGRVIEPKGETERVASLGAGLGKQFGLLKTDPPFRDFLTVRALAVGSGLATPYLMALAHDRLGGAAWWLGIFMIAEGLAAMLTSPLWGRWADRSSRAVLRGAMLLVAVLLALLIAWVTLIDLPGLNRFIFPLALFLLGSAHAGVRVGRKTYVVDMAEGNKRTDYVSVGNTLIGVLLLGTGLVTGLASLVSVELALGIFAALALVGALYGSKLPSVSKKTSK